MLWQILICTQPSRTEMLQQLFSILQPQLNALGLHRFGEVEVLIDNNTHDPSRIGDDRESLRQKADAEYISFLDDDDLISPTFVSEILPLLDGVHQVGFPVKMFDDKQPILDAYLSLQHKNWHNDCNGFYRDLSHICPMRRELALAAPMAGGFGEDARWAADMRKLAIVKTEHYIQEPMYYYLIRSKKNDAKDARDPWRLEMIERLRAETEAHQGL